MGTDPATMTITDLPLLKGPGWLLDTLHSSVHFKVRHIGPSNVRGRFNGFDERIRKQKGGL